MSKLFKMLLPVTVVAAAMLIAAVMLGPSSPAPVSASAPGDCTVDATASGACTSWATDCDATTAGTDTACIVFVGSTFSVDMLVDTYTGGTPWGSYQVTLDYTDTVLDPFGIPGAWESLPTAGTGGNIVPFVGGVLCTTPAPGTPPDAVQGEDDAGSASMVLTCAHAASANTRTTVGDMVRFFFLCETAGLATFNTGDFNVTAIVDTPNFEFNNDHDHDATVDCQNPPPPTNTNTPAPNTSTPTASNTPTKTNTPVPTATPPFNAATMDKIPIGGQINVVTGGAIPLANLFLCDGNDDPGDDPDCDGFNEGELTWIERGVSPVSKLGAFEFQIKFDHKIFDIDVECVTIQDPGPVCTGDEDEDNILNTDADTWDIQLSAQLKSGLDGREWGMDKCFRNLTENYINFACTSTGPTTAGYGGNNNPIDLALVTVHPDDDLKFRLRPGNDNGIVRVILDENCELVDPLGHPVGGSIAGGLTVTCGDIAITVRILEGDLDLDCDVDLADAQAIAQLYGMVFGLFLYDPWYDLEPNITDFDIDAKDLQKVFGRIDSSCQDPKPPQPPIAPPQV